MQRSGANLHWNIVYMYMLQCNMSLCHVKKKEIHTDGENAFILMIKTESSGTRTMDI